MWAYEEKRSWFGWLGWVWGAGLVLLLLAMFFPVLGQSYQEENGQTCCENLELIFQAKEQLARELNIDPTLPYPAVVQLLKAEDLAPYLKKYNRDLSCPSGGTYIIAPLVDQRGEVLPPVCTHSKLDPDGDGKPLTQEGLHVHRRSYLQDVETGDYFPAPDLTFPELPPTPGL